MIRVVHNDKYLSIPVQKSSRRSKPEHLVDRVKYIKLSSDPRLWIMLRYLYDPGNFWPGADERDLQTLITLFMQRNMVNQLIDFLKEIIRSKKKITVPASIFTFLCEKTKNLTSTVEYISSMLTNGCRFRGCETIEMDEMDEMTKMNKMIAMSQFDVIRTTRSTIQTVPNKTDKSDKQKKKYEFTSDMMLTPFGEHFNIRSLTLTSPIPENTTKNIYRSVTSLTVDHPDVKNRTILEFTNLQSLIITKRASVPLVIPQDHSLIITLRELDLLNHACKDTCLMNLRNLERLKVNNNQITLSFLDKDVPLCWSLRKLYIEGESFIPCRKLSQFHRLSVLHAPTYIFDEPPGKSLCDSLESLTISIRDPYNVAKFHNLVELDIHRYQWLPDEFFASSPRLQTVVLPNFQMNILASLSPVFDTLSELYIYRHTLDTILPKFTKLRVLSLNDCDGVLSLPVDHPLNDTIDALILFYTYLLDIRSWHFRNLSTLVMGPLAFQVYPTLNQDTYDTVKHLTLRGVKEDISRFKNLVTIDTKNSHVDFSFLFDGTRDHPLHDTLVTVITDKPHPMMR